MTFVLAVISDENVEEATYVVGVGLDQVCSSVMDYLRACHPQDEDGDRVTVPDWRGRAYDDHPSEFEWVITHREQLVDVTIDLLMAGEDGHRKPRPGEVSELLIPVHLTKWAADNAPGLYRAHTPMIQRVQP